MVECDGRSEDGCAVFSRGMCSAISREIFYALAGGVTITCVVILRYLLLVVIAVSTDLSIYGLCAENPGPFRPDIRAEMLERSYSPIMILRL